MSETHKRYRVKERVPTQQVHLRLSVYLANILRDLADRKKVSINFAIHQILEEAVGGWVGKKDSH